MDLEEGLEASDVPRLVAVQRLGEGVEDHDRGASDELVDFGIYPGL